MINGICFGNAVVSGYNNIANQSKAIDQLNIFPVPDGDTGTNMSMTASSVEKVEFSESIGETAKSISSAMLRNARGNSGVILSIIFRGFAKGLANIETATSKEIVDALGIGVKDAYGTITNPTEGTILTVARVAYEEGVEAYEINDDFVYVWGRVCQGAKKALEDTPNLLPVLKRAGVVDAGGKGLLMVFEGMLSVFETGEIVEKSSVSGANLDDDAFAQEAAKFDEVINFTYCTEFMLRKSLKATSATVKSMRKDLEGLGDCVLVVDDDDIVKVHVHTDNPGFALQRGLQEGELLTVKVENMEEQNRKKTMKQKDCVNDFEFAEPTQDYGFVAVAAGNGVEQVFRDLGCTNIVVGGQTMNPSTESLVEAIQATPAKLVYVLPNNKNVLLAAEQAAEIVNDRKVVIIKTKTIPQGMTAMLSFNPEQTPEINKAEMEKSASGVSTGLVTFAARASEFGGLKMKKNDVIALNNGRLIIVEKEPVKALQKLAKQMINKNTEFATVIYGNGIDEQQAEKAVSQLKAKSSQNIEWNLINGGQPVYYFIISVE